MKKLNILGFILLAALTILPASNCNRPEKDPQQQTDPENKDPQTQPDPEEEPEKPPVDGTVKLYDAPQGLPANVKGVRHKVTVAGQDCFVYRTEATGGGKEYGQVYPEYVYFDFEQEGHIEIEVTTTYDVSAVEVLPSRQAIVPLVSGRTVKFEISRPGQYFLKTGGDHTNGNTADYNLYIFANPKETDIPDRNDPNVVWFPPAVYSHHNYQLESGKTYYLEGGAFLYGRFYANAASDIRICGRGTLCGEFLTDMGDPGRTICFKNGCDNITLEGINIMHAKVWQVAFYQSTNIHINNVHTISHGQSSDGCDITGCQHVLVENSFFRGHDDILAVKSKVWGEGTPMDCMDVTFRNCVIWSDSSNPMTIGYETAQNVKDITYEKIDVLSMSMPPVWQLEAVMAIEPHGMDGTVGNVEGITYRDIRVDLSVPQNSLFRLSVDNGGNIRNILFEDIFVNYSGTLGGLLQGSGVYMVSDVTFRNVRNSDGAQLSLDKIYRNDKVGQVTLEPSVAECTIVGETWDYSTEFGGYGFMQGTNNWYYKWVDGGGLLQDMNYDNNYRWYKDGECFILIDRTDTPSYGDKYSYWPKWSAGLMSSSSAKTALVWKAPASGKVSVNMTARKWQNGGDGVIVNVCKNTPDPFAALGIASDNNTFATMREATREVSKGDEIRFILDPKANTSCDFTQIVPVIKYLEVR